MNFIWKPNPLATVVELDENDVHHLKTAIRLYLAQNALYDAYFALEKDVYKDTNEESIWRCAVAVHDWVFGQESDDPIEEKVKRAVEELKTEHLGDCTCTPCRCMKCVFENMIGVNTIKGLNKHMGVNIQDAFHAHPNRTTREAVLVIRGHVYERRGGWLNRSQEEYDSCVPGWKKEAEAAAQWLEAYADEHFPGQP